MGVTNSSIVTWKKSSVSAAFSMKTPVPLTVTSVAGGTSLAPLRAATKAVTGPSKLGVPSTVS